MMNSNFTELPKNLPVPLDDGAADDLKGKSLAKIALPSTDGGTVELASLTGRFVIYIYPMTGRPGVPLPDGWDTIPGARGCTPQSCSFRDHYKELNALDTGVFGLSAQDTEYQREAHDRLHLPFQLLSDSSLTLKSAMRLPTFRVQGLELYKRLTLIIKPERLKRSSIQSFRPIRMLKRFLLG